MSIAATSWAWRQHLSETGAKLTLVALADFADERGSCYPSQATLASMTSQGVRTVRRHLKELEERGYLVRESRYGHGHRTTDRYVLALDGPTGQTGRNAATGQTGRNSPTSDDAPSGQTGRQVIAANFDTQSGQSVQVIPAKLAREPSVEPPGEPSGKNLSSIDADFDRFWTAYPRRQARRKAEQAYAAARKRADAATILEGALRYRDDPNRDEGYTALPTTWLNGDRWDDEPLPQRGNGRTTDRQADILRAEMVRAQAADAEREREASLFPQIGARR